MKSKQASGSTNRTFVVSGVIAEKETGRGLAELVVRAFDKDLVFDDALGYTNTDATGYFSIRFGTERFQDAQETRPDLFLRIYDKNGTRLLHETSDAIRWDASLREDYRILIPARVLDPRHKG